MSPIVHSPVGQHVFDSLGCRICGLLTGQKELKYHQILTALPNCSDVDVVYPESKVPA